MVSPIALVNDLFCVGFSQDRLSERWVNGFGDTTIAYLRAQLPCHRFLQYPQTYYWHPSFLPPLAYPPFHHLSLALRHLSHTCRHHHHCYQYYLYHHQYRHYYRHFITGTCSSSIIIIIVIIVNFILFLLSMPFRLFLEMNRNFQPKKTEFFQN